jgi:hypothetical protein
MAPLEHRICGNPQLSLGAELRFAARRTLLCKVDAFWWSALREDSKYLVSRQV